VRAAHERELCRWLLAAERLAVPTRAGYGSLREYVARVVGLGGRQTEERLRVGRALAQLPQLDGALASGELCWSAVRELTRVAEPQTEQAWRDWAGGKTTRQVEAAVAARRPGDKPDDRGDMSRVKHRLRFEVRAETMAMFRDLQARVRADLGGDVDDDLLLFEIARRALGGPDDEGRASYQVAVSRCDACKQVSIEADGEHMAVDEAVAEMTACDAQQLGIVDDDGPHVGARGPHGNTHCTAALDGPRVGDRSRGKPARRRATQTVPPATRRKVMRRDHGRCQVEGCANTRFLDLHHLRPRSEGGDHDPDGLTVLCGSHHVAVHRGTLCVERVRGGRLRARHVDGSAYGEQLRPADIDVAQQAFFALRQLGFKLSRAQQLLAAAQRAGAGAPKTVAGLVRAALQAS